MTIEGIIGMVQIQTGNLDLLPSDAARLSEEEQNRYRQFRNQIAARRFAAGRLFLKTCLSPHLDRPPERIRFSYGSCGKPELSLNGPGEPSLQFNLSHSGPHVVVAVAWGRHVGIDIERRDDDGAEKGVASRFMTADEFNRWKFLDDPARTHMFYRLWTRKEAWLKAEGSGLGRLAILGSVDEEGSDLFRPRSAGETLGWRIRDLDIVPECACAVAAEARDTEPVRIITPGNDSPNRPAMRCRGS